MSEKKTATTPTEDIARLRADVEYWQQKWKQRGGVIDRLRDELADAKREAAEHLSLLDGETAMALIKRHALEAEARS